MTGKVVKMFGLIDNQLNMIAHMTRLILIMLVLMSLSCPAAWAEDIDVYDDNYRLQYRIRGDKVYDRDYRQQYSIDGKKIYDRDYKLQYRVDDGKVYDRDYRLKFRTDGDKVYDGDYRLRYRLQRKLLK
ncbi:hypothetical protein Desac_0893 [Desulfobacca acetoxidans DSM 11109]|uniref:Uncharacterized protein n=2 Tax=Desulfobacca acetoxidans TaxID=60893 RepID=F2NGZ6_DESAR|nr:hypothetical protein Desac_0893 [Desulfobacca acetoxidans DSM 11109]